MFDISSPPPSYPCQLAVKPDWWPNARSAVVRCTACGYGRRVPWDKEVGDVVMTVSLPCGSEILPGCAR